MTLSLPMPCEPKTIPASLDTTPAEGHCFARLHARFFRGCIPKYQPRHSWRFRLCPVPDPQDRFQLVGCLACIWRVGVIAVIDAARAWLPMPQLPPDGLSGSRFHRLGLRFLILANWLVKNPSQVDFRSPVSAMVSRNSPTGPCSFSARFASHGLGCQRQRRQCRRCHHRGRCLDEARHLFRRRPDRVRGRASSG